MSPENVEIVRRIYEAGARDDTEAVLACYDPDVEFDGSRYAFSRLVGGSGVYHGHEGLRTFFREYYSAWSQIHHDCEELIEAGDQVISMATARGRGRASGVDVEYPGAALWTIREGKVARVVWFPSREEALEAVGLSE